MTVSSQTSRIEQLGDGTTTAFAVNFYFLENSDLKVFANGVLQTITTNYTVTGAGNPAGGTVTFVSAPANGVQVVIFRDPALTQGLDYIDNDPFPAESHERGLDKLTMIAQRVKDLVSRALRLGDSVVGVNTELPALSGGQLLGTNPGGTGFQLYPLGSEPDTAANIVYTPAGTGAVATTVEEYNRRKVYVADYVPLGVDTTVVDCAPYWQAAFDYAYANNMAVDLAGRNWRLASPVGFPDNDIRGDYAMELYGSGAEVVVDSTEAVLTSKRSLATPDSTLDLFAAKINISGVSFIAASGVAAVLFNGDRLYNIIITKNSFKNFGAVMKSFRAKGSNPDGYLQSVTFLANHFALNTRIVDAKRAFNFKFLANEGETNIGGVYIDGTGDPAVNVLRYNDNLFEGGGVALKVGACIGYSINNNYFESNTLGDVPTLKCVIHMVRSSGGFHSGGTIANNQFQVTSTYQSDVDYRDIKFSGAVSTVGQHNVGQPVVHGNWTNSYQLFSEGQAFTQYGNGALAAASITRMLSPRLHTEARISYALRQRTFLASTFLTAGVYTVCELSTTDMKLLVSNRRPMIAELNLFMQHKTAGLVVTGASVAKILLVLQGPEGNAPASQPNSVFIGGSLMSFADIPAGQVFDTVFGSTTVKHFTAPALTITANGADNYYINLSGYAAPSTANYGPANQIQTHATLTLMGLNSSTAVIAGQLGFA